VLSFLESNTYPIERYILVDDSGDACAPAPAPPPRESTVRAGMERAFAVPARSPGRTGGRYRLRRPGRGGREVHRRLLLLFGDLFDLVLNRSAQRDAAAHALEVHQVYEMHGLR
jgi:hypothetical protein